VYTFLFQIYWGYVSAKSNWHNWMTSDCVTTNIKMVRQCVHFMHAYVCPVHQEMTDEFQ